MFKFRNELKHCATIGQANDYIRTLVAKDCNRIGITDWNIISQVIATGNHRYVIMGHDVFDGTGNLIQNQGYSVCLRKKGMAR